MFQAHSEETGASQHVWDLGKKSDISLLLNKKAQFLFLLNKTYISCGVET